MINLIYFQDIQLKLKIMKTLIRILLPLQLFYLFMLSSTVSAQCDNPFIVNLGNDTTLCEGSALYLDAGLGSTYVWNDGSSSSTLLVTEPGTYFVTVTNTCDSVSSDTIQIILVELPVINFEMPESDYFCKGDVINVMAEVVDPTGTIVYEWTKPNSNDATVAIDTSGVYSVTATDEFGCNNTKEVELDFQYPNEEERILLVTYDPEEDRNIIIYSRTPDKRTMEYEIYNGATTADRMTTKNYSSQNLTIDFETDPHLISTFYNIMIKDSCENQSRFETSKAHKSMLLRTSEDQDGNSFLQWSNYQGFNFEYYYILRSSNAGELALLDSVINEQYENYTYTDTEVEPGITYYYQIRIKTPEIIYLEDATRKKAGSGPWVHSLSNLEDNKLKTGIHNTNIFNGAVKVYPNPFNNNFSLSYSLVKKESVVVSIFNSSGQKVFETVNENQTAGEHIFQFNEGLFKSQSLIYFLQLRVGNAEFTQTILSIKK